MIKESIVEQLVFVVDDIICDICGNSCKKPMNYEYMDLHAAWGYDSGYDGQVWTAEICEECVVKFLIPLIKFKENYDG
jgi:hypothetical protein